MKNKYLILLFVSTILLSVSCKDNGSTPNPPVSELQTPMITKPQKGAVCQGKKQSNGKYKVTVSSTIQTGVNYTFKLWDNKGKLIEIISSGTKSSNVFTKAEEGKRYTVSVVATKNGESKESVKLSFSTPGIQVLNFIPVVKLAHYDIANKKLTLIFYDPDTTDKNLIFNIYTATKSDFSNQKKVAENVKVVSGNNFAINPITFSKGTFVKIIVTDNMKNQSSHTIYVK